MAQHTAAASFSSRAVRWNPAPRVPSRRARRAARRASASSSPPPVTRDELAAAAKARGLVLETAVFGPFFKITARRAGSPSSPRGGNVFDAGQNTDADIIGEHDGFIAPPPFGILHMDSMRIYNSRVNGGRSRGAEGEASKMRSLFGISVLLGATSSLMAYEKNCAKIELLAIDDGNEYAPRLVRYYERLGFTPVRVVGQGAATDLTDLLVWGGVGTRMNGDLRALLDKWGKVIRKQAEEAA